MKLYLIRHAQSANNLIFSDNLDPALRSPDPEITEKGHLQAQRVAKHLADPIQEPRQSRDEPTKRTSFDLTHIYCSLMTRTLLTGSYISEACGVPMTAHPDLFERGGIYEVGNGIAIGLPGRKEEYFRERFPKVKLPAINPTGWYNRPFEALPDFLERMQDAVADIRARHLHTDDHVALVVHGDFIDQFINLVMGVERHPHNYNGQWVANWAFHNTSISRIDMGPEQQTVVYLNRIDHLPQELVTW